MRSRALFGAKGNSEVLVHPLHNRRGNDDKKRDALWSKASLFLLGSCVVALGVMIASRPTPTPEQRITDSLQKESKLRTIQKASSEKVVVQRPSLQDTKSSALLFHSDNPFQIIPQWKGSVKTHMTLNHESLFLGVQTDCSFYSTFRCATASDSRQERQFSYPPLADDHFFEWSDLIASLVYAANKRNSFSMVELGAGWGKWIVDGAAVAQRLGVSNVTAVGVEAQPEHCELAEQHIRTNNSTDARIICAAVVGDDSETPIEFPLTPKGAAKQGQGNFGLGVQYLLDGKKADRVEVVPSVSLCTVLKKTAQTRGSTTVDFVSLDVQSFEHAILSDEAIRCMIQYGVLLVHISLHRVEANDARPITERFLQQNWRLTRYLPLYSTKIPTSVGPLDIVDGRLSFCNPNAATGSFCDSMYDERNIYTGGPYTQHEFRMKSRHPDWTTPGDTILDLVNRYSKK